MPPVPAAPVPSMPVPVVRADFERASGTDSVRAEASSGGSA
jgi:hypothetical protein